jgi:hypothetical protein
MRTNWQQTLKDTTKSSIASYPALLDVSIALWNSASIINFVILFFRSTEPQESDTLTSQLHKKALCHTPLMSLSPPPLSLFLSTPLNVCSSSIAIHTDVTVSPRTCLAHYNRWFWSILLLFGSGFSLFRQDNE